MGDPSSFFGGNTLANLLGFGTAAAPTGNAAADGSAAPTGFDPFTGTPYPTYDPTGSLAAQAAVTGSYAPPAGAATASDTGGTQSDQTTGQKSDAAQPGSTAPSGPAPVTPQSLAAMMAGKPLPTQAATNPWQPGGGASPASPYFSEAQRNAGLQMLAQGQGVPTDANANAQVAARTGEFQPPTSQKPPYFMESAAAGPGPEGDFPPDKTPSSQDKPADATPPKADTPPAQAPQPGADRGVMPGGAGNLLQDIAGLMSGNPMALGKLVQDLMRMAGPPGSRQMPGWDQPWMRPNQASPYTQSGDPSTFGGPQYAGATPGATPGGGSPGAGPQFRPGIGPGQRAYPPGYKPDPSDVPPPGYTMTDDPRNLPVGRWAPARFQSNPPGQPRTFPVKSEGFKAAPPPSAPAAAGPQASTPLSRNEASVPEWAPAARGGPPPMRPTQSSVDRARFRSEATPEMIAQAAWMVNGEVGLHTSPRAQIVQLETAFNRAQYRNTTLKHALMPSLRRGDAGYYDGRSARGTYAMSNRPTPQQIAAFKQNVWDPVMKGSNLSDVGWGPMTGNASGPVARNQFARGTQGYKMAGGDTYFREGPFNTQLPTVPQQMAQQ